MYISRFTSFCNVTLIKGQGPETLVNKVFKVKSFYLISIYVLSSSLVWFFDIYIYIYISWLDVYSDWTFTVMGRLPWWDVYRDGTFTVTGRLPWRDVYRGGTFTVTEHLPWLDVYRVWTFTGTGRLPWLDVYRDWTFAVRGRLPRRDVYRDGTLSGIISDYIFIRFIYISRLSYPGSRLGGTGQFSSYKCSISI